MIIRSSLLAQRWDTDTARADCPVLVVLELSEQINHKMALPHCGVGSTITKCQQPLGSRAKQPSSGLTMLTQCARGMLVVQWTVQCKSYTLVNLNTAHALCLVLFFSKHIIILLCKYLQEIWLGFMQFYALHQHYFMQ